MNPERWHQIEELYHAALERGTGVLTSADPDLRREVEALLEQNSRRGILDQPAPELTGELVQTLITSGSQLGPYTIEGVLGQGGMGQVFRAFDPRLGRHVAIKILQHKFTERFEREARAISALNHPNICTLYDIGPNYLVMELLEGPTLAQEIKAGPIVPGVAARYGAQIASALVEAHGRGIVHRDLKPGNIILTRHGIKVLDFGLATLAAGEPELTGTNIVLGTPAYMAPEQSEGRKADFRTDLFALGLVLYQMIKGRLPYPGASLGRMLASGVEVVIDPPCKAGTKVAARLNALICGLLDRAPGRRAQSTAAVKEELLALSQLSEQTRFKPALAMVIAGIMAMAAIFVWWFGRSSRSALRWPQVSAVSPIAAFPGNETQPAVSEDGQWVAFSWEGESGERRDIYVTRSGGGEQPRRLTHDASRDTSDNYPAWSPNGGQIAFVRTRGGGEGEIVLIPAGGGEERKLREIRLLTFPATSWLAWTRDGEQIVFASASPESGRSTLYLLRLSNRTVRRLFLPPDGVIGDGSPTFSPAGGSLAFLRWSSPTVSALLVQKIGAGGEALGEPTLVGTGVSAGTPQSPGTPHSPAWIDDHRLLFEEGQRILKWEAGAKVEQIYFSSSTLAGLGIAGRDERGVPRLVAAQLEKPSPRIWKIPLRSPGLAGGPAVLLSQLGNSQNPDYSSDGSRLIFVSDRTESRELWIADSDGNNVRQLTKLGFSDVGVPRWSPDGRQVAFMGRRSTEPQIYVIDATHDYAAPKQVTDGEPGCIVPTWSNDGKYVYCSRRTGGETRLYRVSVEKGDAGRTEMEMWFPGKEAHETADGRILYIKNDLFGLFARSLVGDPKANPEKRLVEDIKGPIGYLVPVKQGVYYTGQDSFGNYLGIRFFDFARQQSVDVAPRAITGPLNSLAISPDSGSMAYTRNPRSETDLVLIRF
jgi:Tol biopolymer transport system component/predicted Ser/Thr protein kinase